MQYYILSIIEILSKQKNKISNESSRRKELLVLYFLFLAFAHLTANNIQVSNMSVDVSQVKTTGITYLQFDLQWENSWRLSYAPSNYDAAWIFVKYRRSNDITAGWSHLYLNATEHTVPSTATLAPALLNPSTAFNANTNPYVGAFIYRSANGFGTFTLTNVRIAVHTPYPFADRNYDFQVHAIEMTYVPQATFRVGDGNDGAVNPISGELHDAASTTTPYTISNENAITLGGTSAGNLCNNIGTGMNSLVDSKDDFNNTTTRTLPAAFPKGYKAFYVMKYEITQHQYAAFLNSLTRTQQNNRTGTNLDQGVITVTNRYVMTNTTDMVDRNGIRCNATVDANLPIVFYCDYNGNGTGNEAGDGLHIAANWLSWMDGVAYLDWAGLRPMTELEFEKICRGPKTPIKGEYAWGTNTIKTNATVYTLSNEGFANETIQNTSTTDGNAQYLQTNTNNASRVGIFAAAASNTGRISSGAAYYGAMEMSSNLWERVVTIGRAEGRAFTGNHGNGTLSNNGNANVAFWPGISSGEITGSMGSGQKGGCFSADKSLLTTSGRYNAAAYLDGRYAILGIRGVRTE